VTQVDARLKGMVLIPGGEFRMGSEDFYPEEAPAHRVTVDDLWMDEHPVTVAEFRRFVKATGHVTEAEKTPNAGDYPDADPDLLVPGSLVFSNPGRPVPLNDWTLWWAWVPGACWRHPEGPGSTVNGRDRHPVVHIAHADAVAYAAWAGKELPTEAEWEHAARGGLEGATFPWGDDPSPKGKQMANTWQGDFPWQNLVLDGYAGTSPVKHYPPNGFGLYDVVGNVWEWTSDFFTPHHTADVEMTCCVPHNPRVSSPDSSFAPGQTDAHHARRVIKGGSHLCAPSYCLRYRPAARQGETIDTSTAHIGFRCVYHPGGGDADGVMDGLGSAPKSPD
jgi:formylglycine-generating enzyme